MDALRDDFGTVDDGWVLERFRLLDEANRVKRDRGLGIPPRVFTGRSAAGQDLVVVVHHFGSRALAFPSGIVIVQGFRKELGTYVFAAETGDSIYGILREDQAALLDAPVPGEMWLLLAGNVAGFMGHLGRARIYAFDGYAFRETWTPEDRELLTLTVTGSEIRSTFLAPGSYRPGGDIRNCMDETVKLLPIGGVLSKQINHGECGDPGKSR